MFPILENKEFETHLFLAQTSLNTHSSFCSTGCNPTPLAVAMWYNEHYTFGDAYRYICTSLKLEEKVIFSCDSYHMWGVDEQREAGTEGLLLTSAQLPLQFCCSNNLCISITFSERLVMFQGMEMTSHKEKDSHYVCMGY